MVDDYERRREDFWRRHRDLFRRVRREYLGYWRELNDIGERYRKSILTIRGAVVRSRPETRDVRVQVEAPPVSTRNIGVQTDPIVNIGPILLDWLRAQIARAEQEVPVALKPAERPVPPRVAPRQKRGPDDVVILGCWNCGSCLHFYSRCPLPREHIFCYGCGGVNVTIKDCPRCGDNWARAKLRHAGQQR
ncbi:uncharacterized protein LOC105199814 isoform X2 [Solenopsis invicta]|nr:uncharacterized protein LOC105199814 isoform X2 [Solenopsis invicta]